MATAIQAPRSRPSSLQGPKASTSSRPSSSSYIVGSTPHYATTRRHSLYGTEDRIIIDPGSKVWKVGFGGEGKPRHVYNVLKTGEHFPLWAGSSARTAEEYEEEDRLLAARLQDALRAVFFESLMTDPKSRKVIIVEHPLLPLRVKDLMARILFDNLNIPSLSFVSSHMLALLATGRTSGLVVDCGQQETVALPVSSARPMFSMLRTSPLGGARLTSHLRSLVLEFGIYHPPFSSLGASVNAVPRPTRVPPEILTDALVEDIQTSICFVGRPLDYTQRDLDPTYRPSSSISQEDDRMSVDAEPSAEARLRVDAPSAQRSGAQSGTHTPLPSAQDTWASGYERHSTATDFLIHVNPPPPLTGTGKGGIRIPGWVRERSAEVLFQSGDVDEPSVAEVVLQTILKTPVDLRRQMISNILVIGGTAMLPGFIPRVHQEIYRLLTRSTPVPSSKSPKRQAYDPYESLRSLAPYVSILNNPSPSAVGSSDSRNAGKVPAFSAGCMAWVGGSLAGVLKTGGEEILHDKWDDASVRDPDVANPDLRTKESTYILPDWTRVPMVVGAPHAGTHPPPQYGIPIDEPVTA